MRGLGVSVVLAAGLALSGCTRAPDPGEAAATLSEPAGGPSEAALVPKPAPPVVAPEALLGRVDPPQDPAFAPVPLPLASREGLYGRKEAVGALVRMSEAAAAEGVELRVISAFRSFDDQARIWNNKWTGMTLVEDGKLPETIPDPEARALKILEYSSMPGTSRHHWGTDFDLNDLNNAWFESGEGQLVYAWLQKNAADFGFCQTYTAKGSARPHGYNEERWHWSYAPISSRFLAAFPSAISYEAIQGFEGFETASRIDVITTHVGGVNPECSQLGASGRRQALSGE